MSLVNIEAELKLRLVNPGDGPSLLKLPFLQELTAEKMPLKQILETTYYDTLDHCLMRNKLSFRLRLADGQWVATVKADGVHDGGLHQRKEYNVALPEPAVSIAPFLDTPIGPRLAAALGEAELQPVFSTVFERQILNITMPEGSCIELAVDCGEIIAGEQRQPLAEVELELKSGQPLSLIKLGSQLATAIPLLPELASKMQRASLLAGLESELGQDIPVNKSWKKSQLTQDARLSLSVMAIQQIHKIITAQEAFLAEPNEPEKLHQLRIALRRLRALFSFCKPLFAPNEYQERQTALRQWGLQLGPLRELDVLAESWQEIQHCLPAALKERKALTSRLSSERPILLTTVLNSLSAGQYTPLLLQLWTKLAEWYRQPLTDPIMLGDFTVNRLTRWLHTFMRVGYHLDFTNRQAVHHLRIIGKKLRYTLEIISPALGGEQPRLIIGRLKLLQNDLGELHDAHQTPLLLEQLVKASAGRLLHHDCGLFIGWQSCQSATTRKNFKKNWRKFKKAANRWLDKNTVRETPKNMNTETEPEPSTDHTKEDIETIDTM